MYRYVVAKGPWPDGGGRYDRSIFLLNVLVQVHTYIYTFVLTVSESEPALFVVYNVVTCIHPWNLDGDWRIFCDDNLYKSNYYYYYPTNISTNSLEPTSHLLWLAGWLVAFPPPPPPTGDRYVYFFSQKTFYI